MKARIAVPAHIYLSLPCDEGEPEASIQARAAEIFEKLSDIDHYITIDLGDQETDAAVYADYNAKNTFEIDPSKIRIEAIEGD